MTAQEIKVGVGDRESNAGIRTLAVQSKQIMHSRKGGATRNEQGFEVFLGGLLCMEAGAVEQGRLPPKARSRQGEILFG
jgi:hypothetical protein